MSGLVNVAQQNRNLAAQAMGHPAVKAMLEAELATTMRDLVGARELPEIYRAQARAQLLQKFLTDIENVKK